MAAAGIGTFTAFPGSFAMPHALPHTAHPPLSGYSARNQHECWHPTFDPYAGLPIKLNAFHSRLEPN